MTSEELNQNCTCGLGLGDSVCIHISHGEMVMNLSIAYTGVVSVCLEARYAYMQLLNIFTSCILSAFFGTAYIRKLLHKIRQTPYPLNQGAPYPGIAHPVSSFVYPKSFGTHLTHAPCFCRSLCRRLPLFLLLSRSYELLLCSDALRWLAPLRRVFLSAPVSFCGL